MLLTNRKATTKAESYSMIHKGQEVVLVDTPGFDDSSGLDREVVEETLKWLKESMGAGHLLSGIVYLHRIIDPRITGTARANMRLFKKLCGDDRLSNVALGTTFWTDIEQSVGMDRETQLLEDPQFWKPMAIQGSPAFRLDGSRATDLDVLSHITLNQKRFILQAQEEMLEGRQMHETSAAMTMSLGLVHVEAKLKESLETEKARQQALLDSIEQRHHEQLKMQKEENEKRMAVIGEQKAREEEQRKREEEESKSRAAKEQLLKEKVEAANQVLRAEQAAAARLRYYTEYKCKYYDTKRVCCSSCGWRLDLVYDGTWCYRKCPRLHQRSMANTNELPDCCHCNNDTWYHCLKCGNQCPQSATHPPMERRAVRRTLVTRLLN